MEAVVPSDRHPVMSAPNSVATAASTTFVSQMQEDRMTVVNEAVDELVRVRGDMRRLREEVRRLPAVCRLSELHDEHVALVNDTALIQRLRERLEKALAPVAKVTFRDERWPSGLAVPVDVELIGTYAQDAVLDGDTPGTRRVVELIRESFPKELVGLFELTIRTRNHNGCGRSTSLAAFAGQPEAEDPADHRVWL